MQLSRGRPAQHRDSLPPSPSRFSSSTPAPLALPTPRAPAPFAAFPEQLAAAGGRQAGKPAPARLSGQCGATGGSRQR